MATRNLRVTRIRVDSLHTEDVVMKQNITLSMDKDLLQRVKVLAAQRRSSISQMLSQELGRIVSDAESYEFAQKSALEKLKTGFHLGGKMAAGREELHAHCVNG